MTKMTKVVQLDRFEDVLLGFRTVFHRFRAVLIIFGPFCLVVALFFSEFSRSFQVE